MSGLRRVAAILYNEGDTIPGNLRRVALLEGSVPGVVQWDVQVYESGDTIPPDMPVVAGIRYEVGDYISANLLQVCGAPAASEEEEPEEPEPIPTITLPKNLLLDEGTTLLDCESLTDWEADYQATLSLNASEFSQGTKSIKISVTGGGLGQTDSSGPIDVPLTGFERLSFWLYDHTNDGPWDDFKVAISPDPWFDARMEANINGGLPQGGGRFPIFKDQFGGAVDMTWADNLVRVRWVTNPLSQPIAFSIDDLRIGERGVAAVALCFNDGYIDTLTEAFAYMQPFRMRATLAMQGSLIGDPEFLSAAQLRQLEAAGWTIVNHSYSHPLHGLNGMTQQQAEAEINAGRAALVAAGLSSGLDYWAMPGDGHADATIVAAYQACGVKLAGEVTRDMVMAMPLPDKYRMEGRSVGRSNVTLEQAKAYIDQAIARKTLASLDLHSIAETPSGELQWSRATFRAFIDYIREKCLAGELAVVTLDDIYKLTQGPTDVPVII
jgi:peptidoglycan/xylan/chitin deacetylase (PgdA/CDA1 family)